MIVDPCIPSSWDEFSVVRKIRGAEYRIHVINQDRVSSGVVSIKVDGQPLDGDIIPYFESGIHEVEVELGEVIGRGGKVEERQREGAKMLEEAVWG